MNAEFVRFRCQACSSSLKAPATAAGKSLKCPRCGAAGKVPRKNESQGSASSVEAVDDEWIPVECKLCGTRMYALPDAVGRGMQCPDCGTETIVKPPRPKQKKFEPVERGPSYEMSDAGSAALPRVAGEYVDVLCPQCNEELSLTANVLGERFTCPYCDFMFIVTSDGRAKRPSGDLPSSSSSAPGEGLEFLSEEHERPGRLEYKQPDPPPEHPFVSGVYNFPFYPECGVRVATMSLALGGVAFFSSRAISYGMTPGVGIAAAPFWITAMFLCVLAIICLTMLLIFGGGSAAAIVQDTANGSDEIENWPTGAFYEGMIDGAPVYTAGSLALAAAGSIIRLLWQDGSWELWQIVALGGAAAFLLHPILLLSMFDNASPLLPLSGTVVGSLGHSFAAWVKFHLTSLLPALAAVVGTFAICGPLWSGPWWVLIQFAAPFLIIAAGSFISDC